jgi:hypothetical protein
LAEKTSSVVYPALRFSEKVKNHPHVHGIIQGGGLSPDGKFWVTCKPGFFLSVRVLSRVFRRRFLEALQEAYRGDKLQFFGEHAGLSDPEVFAKWLAPLGKCEWVVYAKRPTGRHSGGVGFRFF